MVWVSRKVPGDTGCWLSPASLEAPSRGDRTGWIAACKLCADFCCDASMRMPGCGLSSPARSDSGRRAAVIVGPSGLREQDSSFASVQPALPGLGRTGGLDLVKDVGVSIMTDVPIVVGIGGAGAQALDHGDGEYGPRFKRLCRWVSVRRSTRRHGYGQHHPPASRAEEAIPSAKIGLAPGAMGETRR